MTPEQLTARKKRLTSAARCFIVGDKGIALGGRHILSSLRYLGDEWVSEYPIFEEFSSALPIDLPVGPERLEWNPEKLLALDPILADLEAKYRSRLMKESFRIIQNLR